MAIFFESVNVLDDRQFLSSTIKKISKHFHILFIIFHYMTMTIKNNKNKYTFFFLKFISDDISSIE